MSFETFEIGTDVSDIGGDSIDLSQIAITDTLIGKTAHELTQALGEPSLNEFEKYHLGDAGISDITIGSFDSSLIQDAGIKPYVPENDSDAITEDIKELKKAVGEDEKEKKYPEDAIDFALSKVGRNADKQAKLLLEFEDDPVWGDEDDFIADDGSAILGDGEDEDIPMLEDDEDFSLEEIEDLTECYISGEIDTWED